jgi:hypothetical protein
LGNDSAKDGLLGRTRSRLRECEGGLDCRQDGLT